MESYVYVVKTEKILKAWLGGLVLQGMKIPGGNLVNDKIVYVSGIQCCI